MKIVRNNLPQPTTSLFGRESDSAAIRQLFIKAPFVTLVGKPGIGKTRLALRIGTDLLGTDIDGVWFIELATVRAPEQVYDIAAGVLGVSGDDERDPVERIIDVLEHQNVLLILDNCEHVREAAAALAVRLIDRCPGLRLLATSREPLGVPDEHVYPVRTLAIADASDYESARSSPAVALFADRAHSSDEAFRLTGDNVLDVARICRQLDGIALAIEVTASHLRSADIQLLASRLRELFGIAPHERPHDSTLNAVLDWTFKQLSPAECRMLIRSTVFAGGWTPEAAAAVCGEPFASAETITESLAVLAEKSLVARADGEHGRFRLLEPMRDFLSARPDWRTERALADARHARYFADLIGAADRAHYADALRFIVPGLVAEFDNIRAAIDWALVERNDIELGCRMVAELGFAFRIIAYGEGIRLTRAAIAEATGTNAHRISATTRARLFRAYGEIEIRLHPEVLSYAGESVASYDALGMHVMAAESRRVYGFLLHRHGRIDEAVRELSQAAVVFRLAGERRSECRALADLAVPVWMSGHEAYAQTLHARAIAWATSEGDRREAARMSLNFAESQFHSGAAEAAIRTATEGLARCEGADLQEILASNIAAYALVKQDAVEAQKYALLSLHLCGELAAPVTRPITHMAGACALGAPGGAARALRLLGFADEQLRAANELRDRTEQLAYDLTCERLRTMVSDAERAAFLAAGARMTQSQVVAEATAAG